MNTIIYLFLTQKNFNKVKLSIEN